MEVVLAALSLTLLAALVTVIVNSRRERDTMLRAVNLSIASGREERTAERAAHHEQVNDLLQRIQAPETATIPTREEDEPSYIAPDDFKAFHEYKERMNGGA